MSIYESSNTFHKSIIIQLGELIYSSFKLNERSDEDILKLINKNETNVDMDEIFNNLKGNFEKTYNDKNNEIIRLQKELHNNYLNGFEEGKKMYTLLVEEKQKQIDIKDKEIELLKPIEHLNTNEKGDEFENMITTELIQKTDRFAYVEDTSRIKRSGDRICVFNDFKIMIECKNKNCITKQDIEQYKDHYIEDMKINKYEIAIMLAYGTNNIIEKGSWNIERYQDNNVIGYLTISKDYKKEQVEKIIITYIEQVIDYYRSLKIKNEYTDETELLYNMLNDINRDILHIEKYELKQIENIQKRYQEKKLLFQSYIEQCEIKNIAIPIELQTSTISTDIFMNKLFIKISSINLDYMPKIKWKNWLKEKLQLDDFYVELLNKKGITRDYIINKNK